MVVTIVLFSCDSINLACMVSEIIDCLQVWAMPWFGKDEKRTRKIIPYSV